MKHQRVESQAAPEATGVLIISSGRLPYLRPCLRSLRWALRDRVDHVCLVDTSLRPIPDRLVAAASRLGESSSTVRCSGSKLRAAIDAGWEDLAAHGVSRVLHVEEDFLFLRRLQIGRLAVLAAPPGRGQVLLTRQRWYASEFEFRTNRAFLQSRYKGRLASDGVLEIQNLFSFNPSLYDLQRVSEIADRIDRDPSQNFEVQLSEAVSQLGLSTAVSDASRLPDVLHLGAVTTKRHNALPTSPPGAQLAQYLSIHAKRAAIVAGRLLHGGR